MTGWDLLVSPFALGVYGVEGVLDRLFKIRLIFCHGDVVREGVLHWFLFLRWLSVCLLLCWRQATQQEGAPKA